MIIQSKKVWIANQFIPAQLEIKDSKIVHVHAYNAQPVDVDYESKRIVPGFIDVHTHGAYSWDTNDATDGGLETWLENIVKEGVTGLCPTTITQSEEVLTNAVKHVAEVYKTNPKGAEILGIHFEGPYLDMKYKGAQPPEHIVVPSIEQFERYQKAADGLIKIITMAPEQDPGFELTKYCAKNGVVVSMGHSAATYEEAALAVANGAKSMTHVYNGMTPFNHRNNGLVGAALRFRDVYGEIICDGNHASLSALNIYYATKGRDYAVMITDSLMAKGNPVGSKFMFGGHEIEIYPDGSAHLTETKGLAGSTLKVNDGLRILVEEAMIPFDAALNSCTINPARMIGLDDHKGKLAAGYDADIVVLEDNYEVIQTYCRGVAQL